jgi:hypothetical protein
MVDEADHDEMAMDEMTEDADHDAMAMDEMTDDADHDEMAMDEMTEDADHDEMAMDEMTEDADHDAMAMDEMTDDSGHGEMAGMEHDMVETSFGALQRPLMDAHAGMMVMFDPTTIPSNEVTTITFTVPENKVGEWELGCFQEQGQHYDDGMRGTLIVEPSS